MPRLLTLMAMTLPTATAVAEMQWCPHDSQQGSIGCLPDIGSGAGKVAEGRVGR